MLWMSTLISSILNNFNCLLFFGKFNWFFFIGTFRLADGVTEEEACLIFNNIAHRVINDAFKYA
jgi:hypothetical protein